MPRSRTSAHDRRRVAAAQYDHAAYRQSIRRNQGWNFWVNVGDLAFVNLAGSFVFISTILPLYASYLTDSRVLIGLIPAAYVVASHGPQLFMAARAEALGRKKPWVVKASVFERVPWLILGLGIAVPALVAPILGGWLIDLVGFRPVFVAARSSPCSAGC